MNWFLTRQLCLLHRARNCKVESYSIIQKQPRNLARRHGRLQNIPTLSLPYYFDGGWLGADVRSCIITAIARKAYVTTDRRPIAGFGTIAAVVCFLLLANGVASLGSHGAGWADH